ncbi:MAG TPA: DNA repair protein RecN, partial [Betaproteobacteria bacterium]|nr:DNA repair protein RecN [Betaproteobacteria bacterium]
MLTHLSVRDFVIVDRLALEFSPGFTVLTGETGAGKSILVDALGLLLGGRSEAGLVRDGKERADLVAEFDISALPQVQDWLKKHELEGDPGVCLFRRQSDAGGRSRAFINGVPVTVQQMRVAGEMLVDIQGQHAHLSLLRSQVQRDLLDAFGGLAADAAAVAGAYREWRRLHDQRQAWEAQSSAAAAEARQLEWQIEELQTLNVQLDEWEALQAEHSRLAHAASLLEGAQYGLESLSEGDGAVLSQLSAVTSRLNELAAYDPELREALALFESAAIQVQEGCYGLRHYAQKIDLDPERLAQCEQRLQGIHECARKYGVLPAQLPAQLAQWRVRLEAVGGAGGGEALRRKEDAARAYYVDKAERLSAERRHWAAEMSSQVSGAMQRLSMKGGQFEAVLAPQPEGAAHGLEQVEFQVAVHAGTGLKPLAKVASGGELSRISLAIQVVATKAAEVPTLVFDEVDVGIGGGVAEIVGQMLRELGAERQVLSVTHLPQVAALGDYHWRVAKSEREGRMVSRIVVLEQQARVEEIARMLGG